MTRVLEFLEIISRCRFEEVHVEMSRAGFFLAKQNRLRGIWNIAHVHPRPCNFSKSPGGSQFLLKEIIPSIDDVTARCGVRGILWIGNSCGRFLTVTRTKKNRKSFARIGCGDGC